MKRLIKNIVKGSFAWEKYCKRTKYYGYYISVLPLHCSYGLIGYTVTVDITTNVQGIIEYDWEKGGIRLFEELVEYLENEIEKESISWEEIQALQSIAQFIPDNVTIQQWARAF